MKHFDKLIIAILVTTFIACSLKNTDKKDNNRKTENLVSINYKDTNYASVSVKDTITPDGWRINYLVKDDDSKYNDIYIKCSNNNQTATYCGRNLIQLRSGFVPYYAGENLYNIFFLFRCATDCQGLLIMNKKSTPTFTEYEHIYDYNIQFGQILYSSEECYSFDENKYMLALKDINKNKDYKIIFDHICTAINRGSCIDTVIFNEKHVTIRTSLRTRIESEEYIVETKTIEL